MQSMEDCPRKGSVHGTANPVFTDTVPLQRRLSERLFTASITIVPGMCAVDTCKQMQGVCASTMYRRHDHSIGIAGQGTHSLEYRHMELQRMKRSCCSRSFSEEWLFGSVQFSSVAFLYNALGLLHQSSVKDFTTNGHPSKQHALAFTLTCMLSSPLTGTTN